MKIIRHCSSRRQEAHFSFGKEIRTSSHRVSSASQASRFTFHVSRFTPHAFSLIEILVTVALLSFIILGLLAMFAQTQRAFRGSMKQVDVMSAGRAATEMLARELAQVTPSQLPYVNGSYASMNLFAEVPSPGNNPNNVPFAEMSGGSYLPLYQALPGAATQRTNIIQRFFFLSRMNQDWTGTGYEVVGDSFNGGVGTLYRFSTNITKAMAKTLNLSPATASSSFISAQLTNLSRIADGIVHFRVRAFATNGFLIAPPNFPANSSTFLISSGGGTAHVTNTVTVANVAPDQFDYYFRSNAVPAYLELELGVLEPNILERFKAIGGPNPSLQIQDIQRAYLSNHIAQVHVFRQRIPIRNVDFTAYQ